MRAQFVYEHIEFKQGGNPYSKLGIGKVNITDVFKNGYVIYGEEEDEIVHIAKRTPTDLKPDGCVTLCGIKGWWAFENHYFNSQGNKEYIDCPRCTTEYYNANESINFTQGGDPYQKLNVGRYVKWEEFIENMGEVFELTDGRIIGVFEDSFDGMAGESNIWLIITTNPNPEIREDYINYNEIEDLLKNDDKITLDEWYELLDEYNRNSAESWVR